MKIILYAVVILLALASALGGFYLTPSVPCASADDPFNAPCAK